MLYPTELRASWMTIGRARTFSRFIKDGTTTLKVQLKARVVISKKYQGKDLYLSRDADSPVPQASSWTRMIRL